MATQVAPDITPDSDAENERLAKRLSRRARLYPYLLILPSVLLLIVVALVPLLFALYLSFYEMRFAQQGAFVGLSNYVTLLTDGRFWHSMWITLIFVLIAVPIEFMLGLIGALFLVQKIHLRSMLVPLLFIPTMMAPIVVGIVWKIMLAGSWGFLSYNVFERFGILQGPSVYASSNLALYAIIVVDIWQWTPFMMLAFFAGLQALPTGPYRAALVDGASPIQQFFSLTFPLMLPLMAVIGLIRLIDAFKIFDTIFLLTGGGPGNTTESVSIYGYKQVFDFWQLGTASALAIVVWVIFFVFCNIFYQVASKRLKIF